MSAATPVSEQDGKTRSPRDVPRIRIVRRDATHHIPEDPMRGYAHAAFLAEEHRDIFPSIP